MQAVPNPTHALAFRHFAPDDAALLLRLNAEATTRQWLPSHVYPDLAAAEAAVAYLIRCYAAPGDARRAPYVLGVELRSTGRLLGHVGFSPHDDGVEVSYAIAEDARGRGYGADALAAGCAWAADAFSLSSIIALTAAANAASRRTLDRAGFVHRADETRRFQGVDQCVSRYTWRPPER